MNIPKTMHGWAALEKGSKLSLIEKPIPELQPGEVLLKVLSCGMCHSDVHLVDNDWYISNYPLVPGHEIIGQVVKVGSRNQRLKEGQIVGVGWQRSACGSCECCLTARDNMCSSKLATCVDHWGGYSDYHVTNENYAFEMPESCQSPEYAPLLCGGITVFSPLCEFLTPKFTGATRVGVVAIGGLGHLAVKYAAHMGYEVTVFSSSEAKAKEAKEMGASHFVNSKSPESIEAYGPKLDLIIVTANVDLPWESYLKTLRHDGTLCFVGIPPSSLKVSVLHLLDTRRKITASPIGSRSRIYEMLEFTERHKIQADIEKFKMSDVNGALERVRKSDVRYRAVLV